MYELIFDTIAGHQNYLKKKIQSEFSKGMLFLSVKLLKQCLAFT